MPESNEKTKATAEKKDQPRQTLSGTEPEKESSVWEKAAETVAGDNKLMQGVLKILLSPITLIVGAGLIIYLFFKVNGLKNEVVKLKEENKKLLDENKEMEEDYDKLRKKHKKLKALHEPEDQHIGELGFMPQFALQAPDNKKTYKTSYLD